MVLFRRIVVALTLISFTACTSMQPIEDVRPSTIRSQVAPGDRASVVYAKVRYDVTITAVDVDALHGRTDSGKAYKFPFEGIQSVDVEQTSVGKSIVAGGVAVYTAVVIFVILLIRSFKFGDPSSGGESGGGGGNGD